MGARRHHHFVSRGYQRLFADGEQIALRRRHGGRKVVVGTRDAFARKDFTAWTDDAGRHEDFEDHLAGVESTILPMIRELIGGDHSSELRVAVKVLAAVHWARSLSFDKALEAVVAETRAAAPGEIAAKPSMLAAFVEQFGRQPEPGEMEQLVRDYFEPTFGPKGHFRVDRMGSALNRMLDKLDPLVVQLIRPTQPDPPFIFGDTPVVHFDDSRFGWRDRLALDDASHIYLPLSPDLAAMFTMREEGDQVVTPAIIRKTNSWIWRSGWDFIAGHPSTDFRRALP